MPRTLFFLFTVLVSLAAHAQLSIEITGAGAQRIPIAIVPFPGEPSLGQSNGQTLTGIVRADLERSGQSRGLEVPPLSPRPTEATPPSRPDAVSVPAPARMPPPAPAAPP